MEADLEESAVDLLGYNEAKKSTTRSLRNEKFQLKKNEIKDSRKSTRNDVTYLCACNRFQTKDQTLFINHIKRCSPRERSLFCATCSKYNICPEVLVKHIQKNQCEKKPKSFNCGMCSFKSTKGVDLSDHIILKHKGELYKPCFKCKKEFSSVHCLMMHLDENNCTSDAKADVSSKGSKNLCGTLTKNDSTSEANRINKNAENWNFNSRPRGRPKKYAIISPVLRESDTKETEALNPNGSQQKGKTENLIEQTFEIKKEVYEQKLPISIGASRTSANYNKVKFDFQITKAPYKLKSYNALTKFMDEPYICHFFKCMSLKCTYTTNSPQHFTTHVSSSHSADKNVCIYCYRDFDFKILADHMVDVHGWRNYQCGECLYRCYHERYLTIHQSAEHEDSSKKFKCVSIKKKVKDDKSEEMQAVYCREYSCTVSKCDFSTKDPVDFVKHLKETHPSETELSCASCTKSFALAEEYVNHYTDCHSCDVFQCGHCYHGTRTLDGMWLHFSKEHTDLQPRIYKRTQNDNDKYINCVEGEKMFLSSIFISVVSNFKSCLESVTSRTDNIKLEREISEPEAQKSVSYISESSVCNASSEMYSTKKRPLFLSGFNTISTNKYIKTEPPGVDIEVNIPLNNTDINVPLNKIQKHSESNFCGKCGTEIHYGRHQKGHTYLHNAYLCNQGIFICPMCKCKFNSFRRLYYHYSQRHAQHGKIFNPFNKKNKVKNLHDVWHKCTWKCNNNKCYEPEDVIKSEYSVNVLQNIKLPCTLLRHDFLLKVNILPVIKTEIMDNTENTLHFETGRPNIINTFSLSNVKKEKESNVNILDSFNESNGTVNTKKEDDSDSSNKTIYVSCYGLPLEEVNLENVFMRVSAHSSIKMPVSAFLKMFDCNPRVLVEDMKYDMFNANKAV